MTSSYSGVVPLLQDLAGKVVQRNMEAVDLTGVPLVQRQFIGSEEELWRKSPTAKETIQGESDGDEFGLGCSAMLVWYGLPCFPLSRHLSGGVHYPQWVGLVPYPTGGLVHPLLPRVVLPGPHAYDPRFAHDPDSRFAPAPPVVWDGPGGGGDGDDGDDDDDDDDYNDDDDDDDDDDGYGEYAV